MAPGPFPALRGWLSWLCSSGGSHGHSPHSELFSVGKLKDLSKPEMSAPALHEFSINSFSNEAVYKAEQVARVASLWLLYQTCLIHMKNDSASPYLAVCPQKKEAWSPLIRLTPPSPKVN